MIKHSNSSDVSYSELMEAYSRVVKMASFINETKQLAESRAKMFEVTQEVLECPVSQTNQTKQTKPNKPNQTKPNQTK